jgi:hypothetical protein
MIGPQEIILFVIIFVIIIPLAALINILTNQFRGNDKIIWVLVVLFIPVIGSILYFLIGRKNRI